MIHFVMLLGACALAAWNVWHWLGRSRRARAWSTSARDDMARHILVAWPLVSLALLCGGLLGLVGDVEPLGNVVALLLLASVLAALAYFLLPLPVPSGLRPRWYADGQRRQSDVRG